MAIIGVFGDKHAPFTHPRYLDFCQDVFEAWGVDRVVDIGDEVDNHAISFHETDPDGWSGGTEADKAQDVMNDMYSRWDSCDVIVGNHSALPFRQAMANGIPKRFMKAYEEVWEAPDSWKWHLELEIDGVLYTHGTGNSGANAHRNLAIANQQSVVMGHVHSMAGVAYVACKKRLIFGMNVGSGVDQDAYALAYGKNFKHKSVLSCGIVEDGVRAYVEPMDLNKYTR